MKCPLIMINRDRDLMLCDCLTDECALWIEKENYGVCAIVEIALKNKEKV